MSPSQDLLLQLIAKTSFNGFNGSKIASSLRNDQQIWRAVLFAASSKPVHTPLKNPFDPDFQEPPLESRFHLKSLLSLENDSLAFDHIFLLPVNGFQIDVERLAQTWNPDEISWYGSDAARRALGVSKFYFKDYESDEERILLGCWWD